MDGREESEGRKEGRKEKVKISDYYSNLELLHILGADLD